LIKIFIQDTCTNCPNAKKLGQELIKEGKTVEFYNVRTPEGLAESLMHNVLSTPSIIITKEDEEINSFRGETPNIEEVKKWL